MLGEIDYVDTYVGSKGAVKVPYPNLTLIFLVIFAITMNIVLVNLMVKHNNRYHQFYTVFRKDINILNTVYVIRLV